MDSSQVWGSCAIIGNSRFDVDRDKRRVGDTFFGSSWVWVSLEPFTNLRHIIFPHYFVGRNLAILLCSQSVSAA